MARKAGVGRTSYYVGEKTDGWISLQYLNGAEGESQPVLVMFLDYTRRMDQSFGFDNMNCALFFLNNFFKYFEFFLQNVVHFLYTRVILQF